MEDNVNILDRESFLEKYHLGKCFSRSGLQWDVLQQIYRDYQGKLVDVKDKCNQLEEHCRKSLSSDNITFHSIRCRPKDSEHLIEKII